MCRLLKVEQYYDKERYLLLNINELRDKLTKVKYFIKFDLREVYTLIRIKAKEKWKTTFRTRYEHYEYTMMSFEFINVSTTCQKMINDALKEYLNVFVIVYLNDILIFFKIKKKYVKHVSTILSCLNKRDLKLKSKKCEFHKIEMKFQQFVINQKRIRIDSKKIKVIKKWKFSINVKKLQFFIEFVNYNRNFIKNFSSIAISLFKFTIKNKFWKWK